MDSSFFFFQLGSCFLPNSLYLPTKQPWGCPTEHFDSTRLSLISIRATQSSCATMHAYEHVHENQTGPFQVMSSSLEANLTSEEMVGSFDTQISLSVNLIIMASISCLQCTIFSILFIAQKPKLTKTRFVKYF